ncbi:hypothetical protein HMI54_006479 [Coelomomyces lativittatus]|nr:hypothetical protein HMI55_002341 [Coelomomyces lativittatus]KAJ1504660.1 hypothetical protein HMI56_001524 [Coelomomyces lativittatus]KAJ1504912.1 hypothetical protein HMI54_006479 [Coelomomyces lativittatus]
MVTTEFDTLIQLEENFVKEGYDEGLQRGLLMGAKDGYAMGNDKGQSVGMELAYYTSSANYLLAQLTHSNLRHSRAHKLLQSLLDILVTIPHTNQPEFNIVECLEKCRIKWKCSCAILGMSPSLTKFSLPQLYFLPSLSSATSLQHENEKNIQNIPSYSF